MSACYAHKLSDSQNLSGAEQKGALLHCVKVLERSSWGILRPHPALVIPDNLGR